MGSTWGLALLVPVATSQQCMRENRKEPTQCLADAQCAKGGLCARQGNAPSMCIRCDTSLISITGLLPCPIPLQVMVIPPGDSSHIKPDRAHRHTIPLGWERTCCSTGNDQRLAWASRSR